MPQKRVKLPIKTLTMILMPHARFIFFLFACKTIKLKQIPLANKRVRSKKMKQFVSLFTFDTHPWPQSRPVNTTQSMGKRSNENINDSRLPSLLSNRLLITKRDIAAQVVKKTLNFFPEYCWMTQHTRAAMLEYCSMDDEICENES